MAGTLVFLTRLPSFWDPGNAEVSGNWKRNSLAYNSNLSQYTVSVIFLFPEASHAFQFSATEVLSCNL